MQVMAFGARRNRPRVQWILTAAVVTALLVIGGRPPDPVVGCSGETPTLPAITSTARLIVELEVIHLGSEVSQGVPGEFIARVHRVFKGTAPPVMTFEWPTSIGLCDGYIATLGDRFIMALGARPFPQGEAMNAMWPIRMQGDRTSGLRDDLGDLLAAYPAPQPVTEPAADSAIPWPLVLGGIVGLVVIAVLAFRGVRSRRSARP